MEPGITIATDGAVAGFHQVHATRLVVLAPAVTEGVAESHCKSVALARCVGGSGNY